MGKPRLNRHGMRSYHQGLYKPTHPEKYIGNPTNITYRSSWERKFLSILDNAPEVVRYGSEELVIPYISPIDGKPHRYYTDFIMEVKSDNGHDVFVVEIKPYSQTVPPKRVGSKKSFDPNRNVLHESEMDTYMVNQAKWAAASKFCKSRGWKFKVITEKQLFGNGRRGR